MKYRFSVDWVTNRSNNWIITLQELVGVPDLMMIEIGSYEGRSAIWFLENILTDRSSKLICIDPRVKLVFHDNLRVFKDKFRLINLPSNIALRDPYFLNQIANIIYIDGSHQACDVLEDAILCFRSLKINGYMIFDDYLWKSGDELLEPKIAIDAFCKIYSDKIEIVHFGYSVIIRKIKLSC